MIGHPFNGTIDAMVERTNDGGAGHQPDVGHARQLTSHLRGPCGASGITNRDGLGVQSPAWQKILIGNDHPCT